MQNLRQRVIQNLREFADKVENDSCEISDEELKEIIKVIAHEPLSKEQACRYLNLSRKQFDTLIKQGHLPKGRKILGYKELRWYKDELE